MTIENLEKELNNKNLGSLYLLYGEELFLLESTIQTTYLYGRKDYSGS